MASLIRQLNSQTSYVADGTTTVWNFPFSYIDKTHVKVAYTVPGIAGYTVPPFVLTGAAQVTIAPAVPSNAILTIYRDTPKLTPMVDFIDRANLTEASLDLNAKQDLFAAAEAEDWARVTNTMAIENAAILANLKANIDAIAGGPVQSVNGRGGAVTLTKADVGLANATNAPSIGKNVLINGNFSICQRSVATVPNVAYGHADRWIVGIDQGVGLQAGSTAAVDIANAPQWQGGTAYGLKNLTFSTGRPFYAQRIEPLYGRVLAERVSTFSGRISHNHSASLVFRISMRGGVSAAYDTVVVLGTVVVPPNVVTPFSITGTMSYLHIATGAQLNVELDQPVAANNLTIYLGDCQWEAGSVATPFEVRPAGMELTLCQRYFEVVTCAVVCPYASAGANVGALGPYSTNKRTTPTFTLLPGGSYISHSNTGGTSAFVGNTHNMIAYRAATASAPVQWSDVVQVSAEL